MKTKALLLTALGLLVSVTLAFGGTWSEPADATAAPVTFQNFDTPWGASFQYLNLFIVEGCIQSWTAAATWYCSGGQGAYDCSTGTCGVDGSGPSQYTNNGSTCSCSCCSANN